VNTDTQNHCGSCTLCCKVLGVEEIAKPPARWCPYCRVGQGCGVYEARPPSCRAYQCVWLQWRSEGEDVPDNLRPDRCHVVIDADLNGVDHYVRPDPARPEAWRKPAIQSMIKGIAASTGGKVSLVLGVEIKLMRLM
jgi:hypothetical protein